VRFPEVVDVNGAWTITGSHLALTGQLLRRHGLMLVTILLGAKLLEALLMRLAVELGMIHRFAGLVAVIMVILLQLVVFVGMFIVLRDGASASRLHRAHTSASPSPENANSSPIFASALLAVLIPFYGYYAGWGFLGNTLRDYSRGFLSAQWDRIDFMRPESIGPSALEVDGTLWLLIPVALIWLVRRTAKARQARTGHAIWPMVVVACEASWVILGLYVLSGWKEQFVSWLAHLPSPAGWLDWPPPFQFGEWMHQLFRYALLPLIWFNLGAIVYGHDLNMMADPTRRMTGGIVRRWAALPKPVTDFVGHFWMGLLKRWHAVANGVLLAASAGVWLTVSILVFWRLSDWLGRWAWIGASHLIGPQDPNVWMVAVVPLNILFGMPGQPQGGVVVVAVQYCVLAAGLSLALKSREAARGTA
jgi:hypothetical protein